MVRSGDGTPVRLVHVYVPDDRRPKVERTLEELGVDYAVVADERDRTNLFQFPLPQGAMREVLDALGEAEVEDDAYVVIADAETALTPNIGELQERYGDSYTPLPAYELQAKARSLNLETESFVWMLFLSTVIATVGLVASSPAVVVGAMVLAPLVGPTLTASVGAVTGDGAMFAASVRQQLRGLVVTLVAAVLTGVVLRYVGVTPASLDVTSLELVAVRLSPGLLSVLVGFAAGSAAALGLTTEGPLSLIGVMISAALVPAAGVAGLGVAYGAPLLALGTVVLLVVSILSINAGEFITLFLIGYRELPRVFGGDSDDGAAGTGRPHEGEGASATLRAAVLVAVVLVVVVPATVAAGQQILLQQEVSNAVDDTLSEREYRNVSIVGISAEYTYPVGLSATPIVTVSLTTPASASEFPDLAERIQRKLYRRTDRRPTVRVTFTEYQEAAGNETRWFGLDPPDTDGPPEGPRSPVSTG